MVDIIEHASHQIIVLSNPCHGAGDFSIFRGLARALSLISVTRRAAEENFVPAQPRERRRPTLRSRRITLRFSRFVQRLATCSTLAE